MRTPVDISARPGGPVNTAMEGVHIFVPPPLTLDYRVFCTTALERCVPVLGSGASPGWKRSTLWAPPACSFELVASSEGYRAPRAAP